MLNRSQIESLITSAFPDNTTQLITASVMRNFQTQIADSYFNLISDIQIAGLGEWTNTVYQQGQSVVYNNFIYQAIPATTTSTSFIISEWQPISTYINSTAGLAAYQKVGNTITLNDNKIVPQWPTDTDFTGALTGFYKTESVSVPIGLTEIYPELGKGLISVFQRPTQGESLIFFYPINALDHYYVRRVNSNWQLVSAGIDYNFTDGLTNASNTVTLGGFIDVTTLEGTDITTSSFSISNVSEINLDATVTNIGGAVSFTDSAYQTPITTTRIMAIDTTTKKQTELNFSDIANNGAGFTLESLSDVVIITPHNFDSLIYNAGTWGNASIYLPLAGGEMTGSISASGNITIDPVNKILYTNSSSGVVDWNNLNLNDLSNISSVDWFNRYLNDSSNDNSIDWQNRFLFDASGTESLIWNSRLLKNSSFDTVLDWNNNLLYDASSNSSIDWSNRYLLNQVGNVMIDWSSQQIMSQNLISIDWFNKQLFDLSNIYSVDWADRYLNDSTASLSVNWELRELYDSTGSQVVVYWGITSLYSTDSSLSIDWSIRNMIDSSNMTSLDWDNRNLIASNGTTITADWSNSTSGNSIVTNNSLASKIIHGDKTLSASSTTTITVTFGITLDNTNYWVGITPGNVLSTAPLYVNNQTTTTFDVVYVSAIVTGTIDFRWTINN